MLREGHPEAAVAPTFTKVVNECCDCPEDCVQHGCDDTAQNPDSSLSGAGRSESPTTTSSPTSVITGKENSGREIS
jgi:hypothetical protein